MCKIIKKNADFQQILKANKVNFARERIKFSDEIKPS